MGLQSKTHGPVSLSKLRDVLKNLEQDKHKQKGNPMTLLERMTAVADHQESTDRAASFVCAVLFVPTQPMPCATGKRVPAPEGVA